MSKRPPQGRGSGGRVTPSAKAAEAAAAAAEAEESAAKASKGRLLRSSKVRAAAPAPTPKKAAAATPAKASTSAKPAKAAEKAPSGKAGAAAAGVALADGDEVAADPDDEAPVWGMGDVLIWWLVSFVAVAITYALVSGYLVSNGTYVGYWPNEEGWAIGEVAGRIGLGQEPSVTVGVNGAPLWLQTLLQLPLWAVLIAGPVYVAKRKRLSLRDDFGLWFKAIDAPIGLVIGIACQLVLVPAIYWVLFRLIGEQDVSQAARALTDRADDIWGIIALFVIVGIGAPIAEELFYRGLSQHAIAKRFGARLAVLLGAAFFGFSHLQPLQFLGLFAFGLVLGFLTDRFDRLGPAIFAHMGFNMTAAVVLVWNLPLA